MGRSGRDGAAVRPAPGQPDLLGEGAAFRLMVESGRLVSILLFGPPGTGKTTLARLAASETETAFEGASEMRGEKRGERGRGESGSSDFGGVEEADQ